jgi:hypothetical protein
MHCKRCNLDRPQWLFTIRYNSPVNGDAIWREPYCTQCKAEIAKDWRDRNPFKSYLSKRNWNLLHPERCRAHRKQNRINQPKTLAAARKRYRKKHWARERLRIRESRKRNPTQQSAAAKQALDEAKAKEAQYKTIWNTSKLDNDAPHPVEYGSTLSPLYTIFFLYISESTHQTDSIYFGLYVTYGSSISTQYPIFSVKSFHTSV